MTIENCADAIGHEKKKLDHIEKQFAESCRQVKAFARKHRLKTKRENLGTEEHPCWEMWIPGRPGASHIYFFGNWPCESNINTFAVCYMPDELARRAPTVKAWNSRRQEMLDAGFTICQETESEGIGRFDPANEVQVRLAMRIAGISPKRQLSADHRAKLTSAGVQALEKFRSEPILQTCSAV